MKEQLITLVNSYAAAKCSGDQPLQEYAADRLANFLQAVEIVPATQSREDAADA